MVLTIMATQSARMMGGDAQQHRAGDAEAKAFALMSEEGIAKGVRRIVAVTAAEATAAIAEGERLMGEARAVGELSGEQQDKAVSTLKQARIRFAGSDLTLFKG